MRKLVLFGLLGGVFGLALLLEHHFSQQEARRTTTPESKAVLRLGGGPPRSIPVEPPPELRDDASAKGAANEGAGKAARTARALEKPRPVAARTHEVRKGESLSTIARAELGSSSKWRELARWNGLDERAILREGTKLRLSPAEAGGDGATGAAEPPRVAAATDARTHVVEKGETLSKIAARYLGDATRWKEIQRLNAIADPAAVAAGSTLKLPER